MWNSRLNARPVVLLARLYLGGILLIAGSDKIFFGGISQFAGFVHDQIQTTLLPDPVLTGFAFTYPYVEFALGVFLVLGIMRKLALPAAGLTFLILSQVQFALGEFILAANNGIHLIIALLALAFAQKPTLAVDNLFD